MVRHSLKEGDRGACMRDVGMACFSYIDRYGNEDAKERYSGFVRLVSV